MRSGRDHSRQPVGYSSAESPRCSIATRRNDPSGAFPQNDFVDQLVPFLHRFALL
jgi:hypothetical protein